MCGSSDAGSGLTGGASAAPAYTPHDPLTYENGQWTQNGKPVNPAGGVTPTPSNLTNPTSPAASILSGATAGGAGGDVGAPGGPLIPQNKQASQALAGMAKGMQFPQGQITPITQQVTPAGPIQGGGNQNNIGALIRALLTKGS